MIENNRQYPLVSVCVPTYNGEQYLGEALDSILNQSYPKIEVIISDDSSSDNTLKIVEDFCKKANFPVRVKEHKPCGIGANWNNCVKHAEGKYIKFLFQDDILEPECVEKMTELAESSPVNLAIIYCRKLLVGDFTVKQKEGVEKLFTKYKYSSATKILRSPGLYNKPRNKLGEPTSVLIKKDVFDKVGFFDERLEQSLDYEFWSRVMVKFEIKSIDETLIKFRVHRGQASNTNSGKIIIDSYLLPALMLKNYNKIHPWAKLIMFYKLGTGIIRYFVVRKLSIAKLIQPSIK